MPQARIEGVVAIAAAVANEVPREPLRITLDVIEYWKKPKLLCATSTDTPGAAFADALKSRLAAAGLSPDLKPFQPHVTLARKAHHPPRLTKMQPVTWSFADFVLVDSQTLPEGSVYTILDRFSCGQ